MRQREKGKERRNRVVSERKRVREREKEEEVREWLSTWKYPKA